MSLVGVAAERGPSYSDLLAVGGFRRLLFSALLARTGTFMQQVTLVLFVLARYHSPSLAGLVVLVASGPGLLISPLAGALLDRGARMRLVALDYALGGVALGLVAGLAAADRLPPWALLFPVGVASLTGPLSNSGTRALFPVIVPRTLWDRANAADSSVFVVATVVGPGLGGVLVGLAGGPTAIAVNAAIMAGAAAVVVGMPEPRLRRQTTGRLLVDAAQSLGYVARNRALRGLAVTLILANLSIAALTVALPILCAERVGGGAVMVGGLWAVLGLASVGSAIVVGRRDSEGREAALIVVGCLLGAVAMAILCVAGSLWVIVLAMAIFGASNGPIDIGLFSLRQRATDPAWMGRAFAVSASLNYLGFPVGSALAGVILERSLVGALLMGMFGVLVSAAMPPLLIGGVRRR